MYSGSDSTESQNVTQWALNPQAYQNMSNDQVDWAALAQQWIIMKEAGPPPIPDPHLKRANKKKTQSDNLNEGGEAPMDMDNEKDEETPTWNSNTVSAGTQPQPPGMEPWGWNAQPPDWAWNNTWSTPPASVPPPPHKSALLPTPATYNQFNAPVESSSDNATFGGYTTAQVNDYSSGYWTSPKVTQLKPHNRKYSKVNVPVVNKPLPPAMVPAAPVNSLTTLDAAKRKTLPAWIREGLEKMERDKQKQLERERVKQGKDENSEKIKLDEKETMEILKSTIIERNKSKFESDGEYSDDESERKKRKVESPEPIPLTHDELMLKVRRTMTEILLKVTNREIESICREELQRHLKRSKASDHRVSAPSGANVTAKLGVGMYGGDSGSSSSEASDDDSRQERKDSDTDLKDSIKRKRADFLRTEREIDDRLALAERRRGGNDSRSSSPDTNDNESQVDAKYQARKPRTNNSSDRTPPHSKSDNRYSKRLPSDSDNSDSEHGRSRNTRRSSSSESDNRSKNRTKSRSRTRSRSSDKKYKSSRIDRANTKTTRRSRSKSPVRRRYSRSSSRTPRRDSNGSRSRRRSRSRSYSRSQRSRSSSYKRSKALDTRGRNRRSRSKSRNSRRSRSRSPYTKPSRRSRSRSETRRSHRRRSRSSSSGRGKRSYRR